MEPLLMVRPPRGCWLFMILIASCVHRKEPVRLVSTTAFHFSNGRSSRGTGGAPMPALLKRRSSRPKTCFVCAKRGRMDSGSLTSVGTTSVFDPGDFAFPSAAAVSKASLRRPARTTEKPSCKSASAECLPTPLPAPVTIATFSDEAMSWSPPFWISSLIRHVDAAAGLPEPSVALGPTAQRKTTDTCSPDSESRQNGMRGLLGGGSRTAYQQRRRHRKVQRLCWRTGCGRLDALLLVHRERDFRAARVLAPVLPSGGHEPLQLFPLLRRELGLGLLVRADVGKPAVRAKPLDLPHLGFHPSHVHRIALAQAHEIELRDPPIGGGADSDAPGIHPELLECLDLLRRQAQLLPVAQREAD